MEHAFTKTILNILEETFGDEARGVFEASPLLQYLNQKTRSASRGSKSRGAFANHYALYVLVEDYLKKGYDKKGNYRKYKGAKFTDLFRRQRELPFGSKLQNHALNSRLNDEFAGFFPTLQIRPIIRDLETNRYWINTSLLEVRVGKKTVNIAPCVVKIIDAYVASKRGAFEKFLEDCEKWRGIDIKDARKAKDFIVSLVQPNVDARIFEIVSYAILKEHYAEQSIFFGFTRESIEEHPLFLYKTGRTNANDGGIDFVMRPVGRFFQVTETIDVHKYFLDIDKVQRFPITFVIKSTDDIHVILSRIREQAAIIYPVDSIVAKYIECIEEIINIPSLLLKFDSVLTAGRLSAVIEEIALQSKVEYNYLSSVIGSEDVETTKEA